MHGTCSSRRIPGRALAGALVLVGVGGLAPRATAQFEVRFIAYSGEAVDSISVFDKFDSPVLNDAGTVLFWARTSIDTPMNDECAGAVEIFPGRTAIGNAFSTPTADPAWCG